MNLYAILRRDGFADGPTLEAAAARSTEIGDGMPDDIRWIRTYVLEEAGGALGTVCIYEKPVARRLFAITPPRRIFPSLKLSRLLIRWWSDPTQLSFAGATF